MSAHDDINEVMAAADLLYNSADTQLAHKLASEMMLSMAKITGESTPPVKGSTGAVAVLIAAAGILHLSMEQYRASHHIDDKTVWVAFTAYQLLFGNMMQQMETRKESAKDVPMDISTVMGAVEDILGITHGDGEVDHGSTKP